MEACPASVLESLASFCVACCPLPADLVILGGVAGSCCMSGMDQDWRLPSARLLLMQRGMMLCLCLSLLV